MSANEILVVDDAPEILRLVSKVLEGAGFEVRAVDNGQAAIDALTSESPPDLGIVDLRMPEVSGFDVLGRVRDAGVEVPLIVLTGNATLENAVEALRLGADDFLTKPFESLVLLKAVRNALSHRAMRQENQALRRELRALSTEPRLVLGESPEMVEIWQMVDQVADTSATVLILGESGTGKGIVAQALHRRSNRKDEPFVAISCAALPDNLLESELFGYEKGAFTGAAERKAGRVELAGQGTLFLDEVGELPPQLQAKLLRVLQSGEFERLGGTETLTNQARLVAATNRDLEAAVEADEFREDLYYRLNVITLSIPPLRERPEDIPLLAEHFFEHYAQVHGRRVAAIDPAVMERLRGHDWPGNVRELENLIERGVILSRDDVLGLDDLPSTLAPDHAGGDGPDGSERVVFEVGTPIADIEQRMIEATLRTTGGDKQAAAEMLGISVRTLYRRLAEADDTEDDHSSARISP